MEDVKIKKIYWQRSPEQRIELWRRFRKSFSSTDAAEICNESWSWWIMSPEVNRTIDPYNPNTWLTFWEMVQLGETCKYSKAIGAAFMIHYLNSDLDIVISRVYDKNKNDIYITTLVENKFLLHPEYTEVMEMNDDYVIQETWSIKKILEIIKYRSA